MSAVSPVDVIASIAEDEARSAYAAALRDEKEARAAHHELMTRTQFAYQRFVEAQSRLAIARDRHERILLAKEEVR
jgi:hypothetical protein